MVLQDELQLAATKEKLFGLQKCYESVQQDTAGDTFMREVTLHSLKKMINQLTEEIARYEAHAGSGVK